MTFTAIPVFWDTEIQCGKHLGRGSYCIVVAVDDIQLGSDKTSHKTLCRRLSHRLRLGPEEETKIDDELFQDALETLEPTETKSARQRLAARFDAARSSEGRQKGRRNRADPNLAIYGKPTGPPKEIDDPEQEPAPKLALKRVRTAELPAGQLHTAQEDFQRELDILLDLAMESTSFHPNIIQLFGIGFDQEESLEDEELLNSHRSSGSASLSSQQPSFLILSQIRTTLSKRLIKWKDDRGLGLYQVLSLNLVGRQTEWVKRLLVLSKVAHALQHLHSHHILYRDVKPDNVGYDLLDIPKLFDFGLAKKLVVPPSSTPSGVDDGDNRSLLEEGLFRLTPETGTLRYMAVEVGKDRPYGWTADVYSLAILMHEVLSLKVPFGGIAPRQFRQLVWTQGERLLVDPSWPSAIQDLLPRMWHADPTERPQMEDVVTSLDGVLRGSDQDLYPKGMASRRTGQRFSLF